MRALLLFAWLGIRRELALPAQMIGLLLIFTALVVSYAAIYRAIPPADLLRLGIRAEQLVWYLLVTEVIIFASGHLFKDLQAQIQDGSIEISLCRPIPLWQARFAEGLGGALGRLCYLLPVATGMGLLLTGVWLWQVPDIGLLLAMVLLAASILLCAQIAIGCCAIWLPQADPVYWIWQKLLFVFGGIYWPMFLYPPALQEVAWFTPFAAIFTAAGSLVEPGISRWPMALLPLLWLVVVMAVAAGVCQLLRDTIRRQGG